MLACSGREQREAALWRGRRLGGACGLALAGAVALAGCAGSRGGPIPYEVKNFGAPDAPKPLVSGADYRIAPLDTLAVRVFKFDELSGDYDVDLTGKITMPLIGAVTAADITPQQLGQKLEQELGSKYLQAPNVSVAVKSSSSRNVTVDGAVAQPGVFQIAAPVTLMQAVALAHGATPDANAKRVAVFRTIQGKRMAAAFDLTSIRRGAMEDPVIYSGDIIVVDGSTINATYRTVLSSLPILGLFAGL